MTTSKKKRLLSNSLSLFANQLTQNATSFILSIGIARTLGAYELGQYTLAFSFYFIFMTMSSQGLKTLLTRDMARNPERIETCLISGTVLQFVFTILAYSLLYAVVRVLPYRPATTVLCWIVGAALIPYGVSNVTESIFQAMEKMHFIAISTVPVYIVRLVVILMMLTIGGASINQVGIVMVISEVVIVLIEWVLVLRLVKPKSYRLDFAFMREMAKSARTFLAIESVSVFKGRMQVFFLSLLAGETVVGLYGATVQLLQPFQLISQSLAVAALPTMSRTPAEDTQRLKRITQTITSVLLVVAIPMVIGFMFIGSQFLVFVYGDEHFAEAGITLVIAGAAMIPIAFTRALSYLMMAKGYERVNLRTVIINTIMGGIVSVLLIPPLQSIGAAISAVLVELSGAVQFTQAVRSRMFMINLWEIMKLPLVAGGIMAMVFIGLRAVNASMLVTIGVAGSIYVVVSGGIVVTMLELQDSIRRRLLRRPTDQHTTP